VTLWPVELKGALAHQSPLTFFAVDASSFRGWLYLMTVALVPPIVLLGLWYDNPGRTIAELMRQGRP